MRSQFVKTVDALMGEDERIVLLLGDIGVHGFRDVFKKYPDRCYNIGICEQATVSLAAGLAKSGLIPIFHTIAPFLVERAFEQLKIDFGYQKRGGNFVSVGASYDYAALGCTHHCPGDVALLKTIPGMEIVVPGTAAEFDSLFRQTYANGNPTYFRLSERQNLDSQEVAFGKENVIKQGTSATVIAVGPVLPHVMSAVQDMDVTVLYYTTIAPFHITNASGPILLVEPFYSYTLADEFHLSRTQSVGVPRKFLTHYGTAEEHDAAIGLTSENIRKQLEALINV